MQLTEKYRPRKWSEVIGHEKAIKLLQKLEASGALGGRAYWIAGKSGTGKTSIARIMAGKLADVHNITESDASAITLSRLNDIRSSLNLIPMGEKHGRVIIINEAHGLKADVIRALLVLLEDLTEHTTFIFTTTLDGQENFIDDKTDAEPLLSRCLIVPMVQQGLAKAFAARAKEIAAIESLNGKSESVYLKLVNTNHSNLRAVLNHIEAGGML